MRHNATGIRVLLLALAGGLLLLAGSATAGRAGEEEMEKARKEAQKLERKVSSGEADAEELYRYAVANITLEQYGKASDPIRRYTEMEPSEAKGWFQLGVVREGQDNCKGALAAWDRAIEADTTSEGKVRNVAWAEKGDCLRALGRNQAAVAAYGKALEGGLEDAGVYVGLGAAQFKLGKAEEARATFSRMTEANPGDPDVHFNLGVVLLAEAKKSYSTDLFRQSAQAFARAAELEPKMAEAWFQAGETWLFANEGEKAKPCLERYLEIRSSGPRAAEAREYLSMLE